MASTAAVAKRNERVLPWIEPTRPVRRDSAFDDPDWLFELKYDGFRALLHVEPGNTRFMSRNGKRMPRFDELAKAIAEALKVDTAILDGELVCLDKDGRPLFMELFSRRGMPYFVAFDLLWFDGTDLRSLPLLKRKARLKGRISGLPRIGYVDHLPGKGKALFESVRQIDLEGIVAKKMNAPYDEKSTWYKIKNPTYSQAEGREDLFHNRRGRV